MRCLFTALLSFTLLSVMSACGRDDGGRDDESLEPFGYHDSKLSDSRYKIIGISSFNYTDYDIYGVEILPPDKNNLDYAAEGHGRLATPPAATDWDGGGRGEPWNGMGYALDNT